MSQMNKMLASPQASDHLNFGLLTLRPPAPNRTPDQPITVIVSGVGRSGTSMTAGVVSALGIPLGKTEGQAVFEDKEFIAALLYFDYSLLQTLIEKRNAAETRWGFKFPSLQNHMLPPQLGRFRNPYLIVVTRDPVATASRAHISDPEQEDAAQAYYNVSKQAYDMMHFLQKARCPILLLSYEKFVAFPEKGIDGIAAFCGMTVTPEARAKALLVINPNNPDYIKLFHHDYRGHFNGVQANHAVGWCVSNLSDDPVTVELLVDGVAVAKVKADTFRQDLKNAGIGSGKHSFRIDLSAMTLAETAVLRVQVVGDGFLLDGSDQPLKKLRKEPRG